MLLVKGEGDGMICGKVGRFSSQLYHVKEVIGLHPKARYLSTLSTVLTEGDPMFLSDSFINVNPTVDQIVEKTKTSIEMVKRFGINASGSAAVPLELRELGRTVRRQDARCCPAAYARPCPMSTSTGRCTR